MCILLVALYVTFVQPRRQQLMQLPIPKKIRLSFGAQFQQEQDQLSNKICLCKKNDQLRSDNFSMWETKPEIEADMTFCHFVLLKFGCITKM